MNHDPHFSWLERTYCARDLSRIDMRISNTTGENP